MTEGQIVCMGRSCAFAAWEARDLNVIPIASKDLRDAGGPVETVKPGDGHLRRGSQSGASGGVFPKKS